VGVWSERERRIVEAFGDLARRMRARVTDLVSRGTTSANDVKPLHVVQTFALPEGHDRSLVLSAIFRAQDGSLRVNCDLMHEDGPILREVGPLDLGPEPDDAEIERAVDAVIRFATTIEDVVIATLEAQRGNG
jgi:hypothetical protein